MMPGRYKVHPLGQAALALTLALTATASSYAAAGWQPVHSDRPSVIDTAAVKVTGALDPSTSIGVTLTLPLANKADLDKFVTDVSTPGSALYGHYLKPAEFAAKYAGSQGSYDAAIAWAKANGLTVTQTSLSRNTLGLKGTAAQLEAAFSVKFNNYVDTTGKKFFAASTAPKMPAALASVVRSVYGMSNHAAGHPMDVVVTPQKRAQILAAIAAGSLKGGASSFLDAATASNFAGAGGSGHDGAFSPADLNSAYQMPSFPNSGKGQALGCFEQGGFYASDPVTYQQYYNLPATPVIPVSVDGTDTTTPVPGVATEAALDIDMENAFAPHASAVYVYESYTNPTFSGELIDAFTKVADDDLISSLDVSYGLDEALQLSDGGPTALQDESTGLEQLAAEGISVYVSAGDGGAYGDLGLDFYPASYNVSDPASQPYATSVGGTTLFLQDGFDLDEITWNELGSTGGATGGGVSDIWPLPAYQEFTDGTPLTAYNGGSGAYRNVPDVAAVADSITPVDVYSSDYGAWIGVGGTSASAPIWAGFTGVLNQERTDAGLSTIGFANPLYYGLYVDAGYGFDYNYEVLDFGDIVDSSNGNVNIYGSPGFTAGYGYDNTTGLGNLSGAVLMEDAVAVPPGTTGIGTGTPANAPSQFVNTAVTATSASFTWHPVRNAKGYVISIDAQDGYYFGYDDALKLVKATVHPSGTVTGLTPNTTYYFYLAAVNGSGGTYDYTDELSVTTPAM